MATFPMPNPSQATAALRSRQLLAGADTLASAGLSLRVLVACEYSAIVRDAFRARGHDAWSCDILPTEGDPRWHIQGDAVEVAYRGVTNSGCKSNLHTGYVPAWDLLVAHPPCTYLANSGAKHLYAGMNKANGPSAERWARMGHAAAFFQAMLNAPVTRIAVENPIMLGHPRKLFGIPEPTQIIQPWQHGEGETKAIGLWLKGLPKLAPSNIVEGREARVWRMAPGPDRQKERSRFFAGVAAAMADQWGSIPAQADMFLEAAE